MTGDRRMRRVTDLQGRIFERDPLEPSSFSSGSEHSAHPDDDSLSSESLSEMVFGYLFDDSGARNVPQQGNDSDSENETSMYDSSSAEVLEDAIRPVLWNAGDDLYRNVLFAHVCKAAEMFSCLRSNRQMFRRNVMAFLRDFGYNAAVCKTKWESSGGLTAGNYEFIDVVRPESANRLARYYIDLDFVSEFQIARPSAQYERLVQSLPRIFVGKSEELKQILRVMSDAARRSLKSRGLHLPPWRKHRFMLNKWFGPYRRTSNLIPATPPGFMSKTTPAVKCRSVGFESTTGNGRLLFPAATRTR